MNYRTFEVVATALGFKTNLTNPNVIHFSYQLPGVQYRYKNALPVNDILPTLKRQLAAFDMNEYAEKLAKKMLNNEQKEQSFKESMESIYYATDHLQKALKQLYEACQRVEYRDIAWQVDDVFGEKS